MIDVNGKLLMKLFYYCPAVNNPTGGVKVIYQHVQVLNEMGVDAWVIHPKSKFKCTWFKHNTPIWNQAAISTSDHLVIPEVDTLNLAELLIKHPVNYSIFVQNGYGVPRGNNPYAIELVKTVYENAQFILSISEDTSELIATYFPNSAKKIIRVQPNISHDLFSLGSWQEKQNLITYMPRKNSEHAEMVIFGLQTWLPAGWKIQPINKVSEGEVANYLKRSKIFLSFSSFEGFGLPPLEAALSGNYVIGYHGNGGKEYWRHPVFQEIYPYDIRSFVEAVKTRVTLLDNSSDEYCGASADFLSTINKLRYVYSSGEESRLLSEFVERASSLSPPNGTLSEQVTLQHSPLVAWFISKQRKFNHRTVNKK